MREPAPGLVAVVYAMHWDAPVVRHVESPLAPLFGRRGLCEQSVTPGLA
jgi:hypothetical protein